MKRILATTAIVALSAGFASAEVTLSGDARMGIIGGDGVDTAFTSRARVKFSLSGETDGGLTFGASFRAHQAVGASNGLNGDVFISTGAFILSMGDVDGAAQAAVGQADGVGLTGLGDMNEIAYFGAGGSGAMLVDYGFSVSPVPAGPVNGDPTALVEFTAGNLSFYASATQPTYSSFDGIFTYEGETFALGAAYAMDGYRLSVGYESARANLGGSEGDADNIVLGVDATFSAITMKARYSAGGAEKDSVGSWQDHTQWSLSATYVADALSVTGYVSDIVIKDPGGATDFERQAWGLGAAYDLGGGASVVGGYAVDSTADVAAYDLGLSFSF